MSALLLNLPFDNWFEDWQHQQFTREQITQALRDKNLNAEQIDEIYQAYKKKLLAKRQQKGFSLMLLGAVLGFISCMLTLFNVMPEYRDVYLVGLTTLAVCIAVGGCYYVFE